MTSSDLSDCPLCGGPLAWRQARPYPVLLQLLFGLSFVAFLLLLDEVRRFPGAVWAWCAAQVILGAFLVRGRLQAKKRILRCIRCEQAVR